MEELLKEYEGKTIVFCIPGCRFSRQFVSNLCELINFLNKNKINTFLSQSYSPEIHQIRAVVGGGHRYNGLHQSPFTNQIDYDYLMWVDSDIDFSIQNFVDLLKTDKDLCTGWYYQSDGLPVAGYFKTKRNRFSKNTVPFELYDGDNLYTFKNAVEITEKTEPYIIDWCGMGWMLMKRGVMERIKYPWFAPKIVRYNLPEAYEVMSEDLSFAMSLKEAGIEMWVNPLIKVGHEKPKVY